MSLNVKNGKKDAALPVQILSQADKSKLDITFDDIIRSISPMIISSGYNFYTEHRDFNSEPNLTKKVTVVLDVNTEDSKGKGRYSYKVAEFGVTPHIEDGFKRGIETKADLLVYGKKNMTEMMVLAEKLEDAMFVKFDVKLAAPKPEFLPVLSLLRSKEA